MKHTTRILAMSLFFAVALTCFMIPLPLRAKEKSQSVQTAEVVLNVECEPVPGEVSDSAQLTDGCMVIVGSTGWSGDDYDKEGFYDAYRTPGNVKSTGMVVKYTIDGKIDYVRAFGGNDEDRFTCVIATADGGFVASGCCYSTGGGDYARYGLQQRNC